LRIGIIFGGKSFEHEISVVTTNLIYHALNNVHQVYLLYIDKKGNLKMPKEMKLERFAGKQNFSNFNFMKKGIKKGCRKIELDVIINCMHGINGEDGLASVVANLYDIPFVGTNHISAGSLMDKSLANAILKDLGIKVVDTYTLLKGDEISVPFDYPIILKPARLGSSIGIKILHNQDELKELDNVFTFDDKIVVQPYIKSFKEINQAAYIYKGKVVTSKVEEVFKNDEILSFVDKYIESKIEKKKVFVTDENVVKRVSEITEKIYKSLELSGIVRIDYMIIDDEIFINEINTTPGSLSYYLFNEEMLVLIERQIYEALIIYQNRRETTFSSDVLTQKNYLKK